MKYSVLTGLLAFGSLFVQSCGDSSAFKGSAKKGTIVSGDAAPATPAAPVAVPLPAPAPTVVPAPNPEVVTSETSIDVSIDNTGIFKNCESSPSSKFVADLYSMADQSGSLPDFSAMTSLKRICLNQLDITSRDFQEGFPGVDNLIEWFALNINFKLNVETAGDHTFALTSDDGSILNIDGVDVVLNDGQHGAIRKEATVNLSAGSHAVNIRYFQGPRFSIALELKMKAPGQTEESYIPLDAISRP